MKNTPTFPQTRSKSARLLLTAAVSVLLLLGTTTATLAQEKYRVVIMTDMTHDDGNSLIRYLYYANEFDTEAIIITPQLPDFNYDAEGPWLKGASILDAYAQEYDQLKKHHNDYPSPAKLRAITKQGRGALPIIWLTNTKKFAGNIADRYVESEWGDIRFADWIGEGNTPHGEPKDSEGSEFLQEVFAKDDDRPIYVEMWGGPVTFIQALYRYKQKNNKEDFVKLLDKLHIFGILLQDISFDYLISLDKVQALDCTNMGTVQSTYEGERVQPRWLLHDAGHFWHYVFSRDSGYVKPMPAAEVNGHGPMSNIYDNGGEGDTPSFLYLLSANRGLNNPEEPTQGSWGSLFAPMGPGFPEGYFHTCGVSKAHLTRWVEDAKLSFENRLAYSLKDPAAVNHEPLVVVNGKSGSEIQILRSRPGEVVKLDASASSDRDNDGISFSWYFYPEASTVKTIPVIDNGLEPGVSFRMPGRSDKGELHLILEVKDSGSPSLKSYRRFVIKN